MSRRWLLLAVAVALALAVSTAGDDVPPVAPVPVPGDEERQVQAPPLPPPDAPAPVPAGEAPHPEAAAAAAAVVAAPPEVPPAATVDAAPPPPADAPAAAAPPAEATPAGVVEEVAAGAAAVALDHGAEAAHVEEYAPDSSPHDFGHKPADTTPMAPPGMPVAPPIAGPEPARAEEAAAPGPAGAAVAALRATGGGAAQGLKLPKNPRRARQIINALRASGLPMLANPYAKQERWGKQETGEALAGKWAEERKEDEAAEDREARARDSYYGMDTNWAFQLDPTAFQPSHILQCDVEPASHVEFHEDITVDTVSRAIRGDWFATTPVGDGVQVVIKAPDGSTVYHEGPFREMLTPGGYSYEAVVQGAFSFYASQVGTYTASIINMDETSTVQVAFAWLLGKDDDDPLAPTTFDGGAGEAAGGNSTAPTSRGPVDPLATRVSALHKKIDSIAAAQMYADVRYKRHFETVLSTRRRFAWYTLAETLGMVLCMTLQVMFLRRLEIKPQLPSFV